MLKQSMIRQFLKELPELEKAGILDPSGRERIAAYYRNRLFIGEANFKRYSFDAFSILSAVFILAGVILLFAHNWDSFPRFFRIICAFAPLAAAAVAGSYTILRGKGRVMQEISSLLSAGAFSVLLALIAQIYHQNGSLSGFLHFLIALSIPLVYCFQGHVLCLLCCIGMIFFDCTHQTPSFWTNDFLYFIALLFFPLWKIIRDPHGPETGILRYSLIPLAIALLVQTRGERIIFALLFSLFAIAGICERERLNLSEKLNIFSPVGTLGFMILLVCSVSVPSYWNFVSCSEKLSWSSGFFLLVMLVLLLFSARKKHFPEKAAYALFPFLLIAGGYFSVSPPVMMNISCAYFFIFCLIFLISGFRKRNLMRMNYAMFFLSLLIFSRFTSSETGILQRALQFISCGTIFLCVNLLLLKIRRKELSK